MNYYKPTSLPQKFWKVIRLYVLSWRARVAPRRTFKRKGHSVLHVISELDRVGGLELQGLELARALTECGDFITILTDVAGTLPHEEFRNGFLIHRLPFRRRPGKARLFFSMFLFFIGHGRRYEIVHVHGVTGSTLLALRLGLLLKRPVVLIAQTKNDFNNIFSHSDLKHRIYQRWLLRIDRCIAISEELRSEMKACGIPDSRIHRIPNVVNSARFSPPTPAAKQSGRSQLSIRDGELIFLFLGRLVPRKGADVLLHAWKRKSPGVLWIVGDGPERTSLEQLARHLDLTNVSFFGQTNVPLEYYQAADVFVLPSRSEGLPCVTLEAMSCGLPIIASSIGGVVEQVRNDGEGLLVSVDDPEALADAMQRMAADNESRARWGKQALETVKEKYEVRNAASLYHQIYSELVR